MNRKLTIAIDGHSSCGKSTFAKQIAGEMGYLYIDSGAMYRAATLYFLGKGYVGKNLLKVGAIEEEIDKVEISFTKNGETDGYATHLNGINVENEIRGIEVSAHVSPVSAIGAVRAHMVKLQRHIGKDGGIVMDGRDIGTVVFPEANIKIFMTASVDVRAKRRYDELIAKGVNVDLEEIRKNIILRDLTDENRAISPLRRADDALILDNSRMTVEKQMVWVRKLIEKKLNDR